MSNLRVKGPMKPRRGGRRVGGGGELRVRVRGSGGVKPAQKPV